MDYVAYFLCDTCGHKWKTYYSRVKTLENGDVCENCMDRPTNQKNFLGCVVEPYLYERVG